MEHRWGQRFAVDVGVQIACRPAAVGSGHIVDVSMSGAFVATSLQLPLFAQVDVGLPAVHPGDKATWLTGFVVRHDRGGIGVEWTRFAPEPVAALLQQYTPEHEASLGATLDHYRRTIAGATRP